MTLVNVSGSVPEALPSTSHGVCIYANGTWDAIFPNDGSFICERKGGIIHILLICTQFCFELKFQNYKKMYLTIYEI